jgi:hypothetical protein
MSGMAVSSSDFSKMMQVRQKLLEVDTILYEITRDWRVSGFRIDNQQMREACRGLFRALDKVNLKVHEIFDEACKSEVTGK